MTLLYEEVYKDRRFSAICRKSSRCCMVSYNYNFISRNRIISEFGNTFYTVQGNEEFNKINVSRERRGRRGYYTISGLKYIYGCNCRNWKYCWRFVSYSFWWSWCSILDVGQWGCRWSHKICRSLVSSKV